MITNNFTFRGKDYSVNIPEFGVDDNLVPNFEVLDQDTQLTKRFNVIEYRPDFRNKAIYIQYESVLVSNEVEVDGTKKANTVLVTRPEEYAYFYVLSLNGAGVSRELINGILFNELQARCFTSSGSFYQPISLDFSKVNHTVTPATEESAEVINDDGQISITVIDSDVNESLEFSVDGINWQASPSFTGLPAGIYNPKARYVGTVLRTVPSSVEIMSTEPIKVTV